MNLSGFICERLNLGELGGIFLFLLLQFSLDLMHFGYELDSFFSKVANLFELRRLFILNKLLFRLQFFLQLMQGLLQRGNLRP